jgi:transketolase
MTPRDTFWEQIEIRMENDSRIIVLAGDMGAPKLDNIRRRFPHRFRNCGCSEQAMVDMAVGWALEEYWPICYGIAPFVTSRCYEQIKMAAVMGANVTIVGVGAGLGYADAGPTHHAVDDYNIMRIIPGMTVFTPTSQSMTLFCARQVGNGLTYIRLDREYLPEIHHDRALYAGMDITKKFDTGVWVHHPGKRYIIAHGYMVHRALQVAEKLDWGVIELFRTPWEDKALWDVWEANPCILEEGYFAGGLRSAILERYGTIGGVRGVGIHDVTGWGTRQDMHMKLQLGEEDLISWLSGLD